MFRLQAQHKYDIKSLRTIACTVKLECQNLNNSHQCPVILHLHADKKGKFWLTGQYYCLALKYSNLYLYT